MRGVGGDSLEFEEEIEESLALLSPLARSGDPPESATRSPPKLNTSEINF